MGLFFTTKSPQKTTLYLVLYIIHSGQTHLNYTDYHLQQHYTSSKDRLWIPQNVYPKGSVLQKSNASALIVPYLDFINKHFFHHEWHYGLCGR